MFPGSRAYKWLIARYANTVAQQRFARRRHRRRSDDYHFPCSLEQLEPRVLLSATFELSLFLPANGGDGTDGVVINGIAASDQSGYAVSSAGDVNGDGFDDVVIGSTKSGPGESYVVFGQAGGFTATFELSNLDGNNGFVIRGIDDADFAGRAVSSAGDVNGDGVGDLLIGAHKADPNSKNYAGEAYVLFGTTGGFPASFDLSTLLPANGGDGIDGFVINGIDPADTTGDSVSSAGDINGDGFDDLMIAATGADPHGISEAGRTYIVFGKGAGFTATMELSSLLTINGGDGTDGFIIDGAGLYDKSGRSISSAGDFNGDGFDDLLIGAPYANIHGIDSGDAYIIFGNAGGFPSVFELGDLFPPNGGDGTQGLVLAGVNTFGRAGSSVSSAGDINGDGFDDLGIAASHGDPGGRINAGEAYVVFGNTGGFDPIFDLSSLLPINGGNGTNGFVINGINPDDNIGIVSSAGDINGDGFDDIAIGAPLNDFDLKTNAGTTYLVFGKATGFGATLELSALDGTNGLMLRGINSGNKSGASVALAGDVNGDGLDDLIIGARDADPNGMDSGQSYIFFGQDLTGAVSQIGDDTDNTLTGTAAAEALIGGQGDDVLIGNGGADTLRSGQGDDTLAISDTAFQRLIGGTGTDTLRLDTSGLTLDLTAIPDNKITGIERIDITGLGPNTLVLDALEVLNISDTSNTLIVIGDADDTVQLGFGWAHAGIETINAQQFNVFNQIDGIATVKVSTDFMVLSSAQIGDFNNDSVVDDADIDLLAQARRASSTNPLFDVNTDGSVDFGDTDFLVTVIIGTVFGDANLDLQVEDADLSLLLTNFGTRQTATWFQGDFNGDGDVEDADLSLLLTSFGTSLVSSSLTSDPTISSDSSLDTSSSENLDATSSSLLAAAFATTTDADTSSSDLNWDHITSVLST